MAVRGNKAMGRGVIEKLRERWHVASYRAKWGGGTAIAVAVVFLCWHGLAGIFAPAKKISFPPVVVAKAEKRDITVWEHAVGTVVADATVNVTARVSGEIVAIGFKEGQDVRKGNVLFRLDPRPLKAAVEAAAATRTRDSATLANARQDAARYKVLAGQNAVSLQTRDAAIAAAKAAEATVAADRAALDTARLNLEYATIRSPIDGKTGAIAVQIGNQVVANATTVLVTVTKDRPVKVSFFLPQNKLTKIQTQRRAGRLAAVVTTEGSDRRLTAPVDFVGNAVGATTGTIELRATLPNADRTLVPGQMVSVDVALETLTGTVAVPRNAVNQSQNGPYVFVVAHGIAKQVPVLVRTETDSVAAVAGKITPGDQVVTDGQLRVVAGHKVRIGGHGAGKSAFGSPGAQ